MKKNRDYGRRDKRSAMVRLIGGLILCLLIVILELTVGHWREKVHLNSLSGKKSSDWAINRFLDPTDTLPIPPKEPHLKRLLYISNSHAKTGGFVTRHLQKILDTLAPGSYEVLDLSDPGIFAPDMLQRFLTAIDYDLDAVILSVGYISFSDRMKLSRQSLSARSFFKSSIFNRLAAGFWFRNYDLNIYGDTLTAHYLRIFRYRNDIRDLWEKPTARYLKLVSGDRFIRFLEFDENQGWKFPDGFDRNLFDWSLYAIGRDGHLADIKDLVNASLVLDIPLLAFNLPVDWVKEPRYYDQKDVEKYRRSLESVFFQTLDYVDYQDIFPKEFTTYDAFHPTWHGARLHALDLILKLNKNKLLWKRYSEKEIVDVFLNIDQALSLEYRQALNGRYNPKEKFNFRRLDIFEPDNARDLFRRLSTFPIGSQSEWNLIRQLSLRIQYWQNMSFDYAPAHSDSESAQWYRALQIEIERTRERALFFKKELVRFEIARLANYPIPNLNGAVFKGDRIIYAKDSLVIKREKYELPDGRVVIQNRENDKNRIVNYLIIDVKNKKVYQRSDIIGDGSFILLEKYPKNIFIPNWVFSEKPRLDLWR